MPQLDFTKFALSLFRQHGDMPKIWAQALKEHGYEYIDGELLSTVWYKCTQSFETSGKYFCEGSLYRLCDEIRMNIKHLRLATDEEKQNPFDYHSATIQQKDYAEPQEKTALEKAADEYIGHSKEMDEDAYISSIREAFIAGGKWMAENNKDI